LAGTSRNRHLINIFLNQVISFARIHAGSSRPTADLSPDLFQPLHYGLQFRQPDFVLTGELGIAQRERQARNMFSIWNCGCTWSIKPNRLCSLLPTPCSSTSGHGSSVPALPDRSENESS